ncbi:MAG: hypothetical protein ACWGQW_16725 [bacterium]
MKQINLIQVKAISKKMLRQMRVVKTNSEEHREIRRRLAEGNLCPLGWIRGTEIDDFPGPVNAWLVRVSSEYVLVVAPGRESPEWDMHKADLEQLFVT